MKIRILYILLYLINIIYPIFKSISLKNRFYYNCSLIIIYIIYNLIFIKLIIIIFYLINFQSIILLNSLNLYL